MNDRAKQQFGPAPVRRGFQIYLTRAVTAFGLLAVAGVAPAQDVVEVGHETLTCAEPLTFDDVPLNDLLAGIFNGNNYDGVFSLDGVSLAERFAGQSLGFNGEYDELSGAPSAPLSLQPGSAGANLNLVDLVPGGSGNAVLAGMGESGFPAGFGDGSIALLFGTEQSAVGFDWFSGSTNGAAELNFFRADGSLISTVLLDDLETTASVGFARAGGVADIAGFSIHNTDPSGVGIDNLCFESDAELAIGIETELLFGPLEVPVKGDAPTAFVMEIRYSGPDALVIDTVPSALQVVSCVATAGSVEVVSRGKNADRAPTRLEWTAPEGESRLACELETRLAPSKGKKQGPVYQPSGCGLTALSEGATAYELDPETGELVYVEQEDPESGLMILAPAVVTGPAEPVSVVPVKSKGSCDVEAGAYGDQGLTRFRKLLED